MSWKTALAVFGGVLGICCGEALKLGYTDWAQLGQLTYWLGVGVQIASLIGVYVGGLYTDKPKSNGQAVDLTKVGKLILPLLLLIPLISCAGRLDNLVRFSPVIASEIASVQGAVEQQKEGLLAADCTVDQAKPQNCYVAFQKGFIEIMKYHQAYDEALAAVNTTSVKQALANMSGVVSGWVQREVLRLPEKVRLWVVLALESLRASLLVAQQSVGG